VEFPLAVILIVEDEVFTRELAGMCIEDWGHKVLFAGTVAEAMGILKTSQAIDALFTDIYLKAAVYGGCDVAKAALALRPDLRVLYTTGNAATDLLKARFVLGSHFLSKPYTPNQLRTSVDSMLGA
jgi:CheY-like chemotaxis protein